MCLIRLDFGCFVLVLNLQRKNVDRHEFAGV